MYCFLISKGNRHILFDLAVRRDWENYAPNVVSIIKKTTTCETEKNVSDILDDDKSGLEIGSKDIEAVIWSHSHFDHIGDPSAFPPSTDLVVGPGFKQAYWPGYPTNPESLLLDSDAEGRNFREIDIQKEGNGLKIGRFDAMDYFGDGSFYLLDAPGHAVGHMCGLARTTSSPDSFVFMGADACHHVGILRPTEYLPLPLNISPSPIERLEAGGCPGALLQQIQPEQSASKPFFTLTKTLFPSYDEALETVHKMEELDANAIVFVIIAHDVSLQEQIDFFPRTINDWMAKGMKPKTRWLFCKDFAGAIP